jgi:hypothetical protein
VPLFIGNEVTSVRGIAIPLCLWALFGFAGGLAIDRGWRKGSVTGIVLSVLLSASLVISILRFTGSVNSTEIALGASAILGWCMTLLLFPSARTILRKQECPG